jgi:hypothetical protein
MTGFEKVCCRGKRRGVICGPKLAPAFYRFWVPTFLEPGYSTGQVEIWALDT